MNELARLLCLERAEAPAEIHALVYSIEHQPEEIAGILQKRGGEERWKSHDVRDRIRILESPERDLFLCGVKRYPSGYPDYQTRWLLISFLVGSILALLSNRLLLIHGALVTDGEKGHVLTGPSGSGKSTAAARVPPPWIAPADDLLAAVSTREGYALHPLPTWSLLYSNHRLFRPANINASFSLSGVHFLEKSRVDQREAISLTSAIERLLWNSYRVYLQSGTRFTNDVRYRCKVEILRHAAQILDETPVDVLKVTRKGRFWEMFPTE